MRWQNLLRGALIALLLALVLRPVWFTPVFAPFAPEGGPVIYDRSSLLSLSLSHLGLVALASTAATLVSVMLAILVTRPAGAAFRPLSRTITNMGQTFPPVAVLALAVRFLATGLEPEVRWTASRVVWPARCRAANYEATSTITLSGDFFCVLIRVLSVGHLVPSSLYCAPPFPITDARPHSQVPPPLHAKLAPRGAH